MDGDEYDGIYRMNMLDEWINGAYDEDGNDAVCDICLGALRWDPSRRQWHCPDCGQIMDRALYFNHIGAEPPGAECLRSCGENYPLCKRHCERYPIDPSDPMLT